MTQLHDVVAVNLVTNTVRVIASGKTQENAEAIVNIAVTRRGVEEEFFTAVRTESYKDGDKWEGDGL